MKMYGLLILLAFFVAPGNMEDWEDKEINTFDEDEVEFVFNCFGIIACEIREIQEFERLYNASGVQLKAKTIGTYCDCYEYPHSHVEFIRNWDGIICSVPTEKRRHCFVDSMKEVGNFIERMCERALFDAEARDECEKAQVAMATGKNIIIEHTRKGNCYNPKKMMKG